MEPKCITDLSSPGETVIYILDQLSFKFETTFASSVPTSFEVKNPGKGIKLVESDSVKILIERPSQD